MTEWFVNHPAGHVAPPDPDISRFHRRLPSFAPTPLHVLEPLGRALGIARVLVKDESQRAGLPSFKILGASWATYRALRDVVGHGLALDRWNDLAELGRIVRRGAPVRRLVAATDGNHGRAVARVAGWIGLSSTIVVPASMSAARREAIWSEGAELVVVDGSYGQAVERAASLATADTLLISDTTWGDHRAVGAYVSEGYATLFAEVAAQSTHDIDLIVVQMGVGALAAAAVTHAWSSTPRPVILGVEAIGSECVLRSIQAGRLVTVPGPHPSMMVGLNCDTPSAVAWPALAGGMDVFATVDDGLAATAVVALAEAGVTSGESGAAGLAGLLLADADPALRQALGLGTASTVLVISTEGATDPEHHQVLVGSRAAAARSA